MSLIASISTFCIHADCKLGLPDVFNALRILQKNNRSVFALYEIAFVISPRITRINPDRFEPLHFTRKSFKALLISRFLSHCFGLSSTTPSTVSFTTPSTDNPKSNTFRR